MPLNLEAGSRAKIGQKLGVRLDAEINASVDIELRTNDGVVMVAVQPWYELNGRRQRLEAADVRKDVLRMQAQLTKNEKELSQARYGLAQVPGELSRLQRVVPTTGHEAVALQGRFRQLEATASSLQSKVKRLSEVQPKLADSVKTLERVAALAEKMSKQLVLYHRVVLEGEFADLVLLQATPNR